MNRVGSMVLLLFLGSFLPGVGWAHDNQDLLLGVVKITATVGGKHKVGSGIVLRVENHSAYIVTASHVIEGDPSPSVEFFSRRNHPIAARPIGLEGGDPRGLAGLIVDHDIPSDVHVFTMDHHRKVRSGDPVTMIGFPRRVGTPWAVTKGEIVGRNGKDLVFSGAIDEGNSGSPLLKDGHVIGIVTEASPPFAYASPAAIARYILESWGVKFGVSLRAQPATISPVSLIQMIQEKGFHHPFDASREGLAGGTIGTFEHSYERVELGGQPFILDYATALMWQQSGSSERIAGGGEDKGPQQYIGQLNRQQLGGFADWRLPTIEELASLLEPIGINQELFIDPMFNSTQKDCWSSDLLIKVEEAGGYTVRGPWELFVDFVEGRIDRRRYQGGNTIKIFVRAVRTFHQADGAPLN